MSKKKFYVPLIATATAFFTVAMFGVAAATDNLLTDGVIATTPVANENLAFGNVCPGNTYPSPSAANVALAIQRGNNDTNRFEAGADVAVSPGTISYPAGQAAANGTLSAPSPTGTIEIPDAWTEAGTLSPPISTTVTLTVGSSATPGSYSGTVQFSAQGDKYNATDLLTRNHEQPVGWTVLSSTNAACVSTPTNNPPDVSVTGVTNGANYEYGSVPAASCSVSDIEDGSPTVAPVIGAVTGPLSAYGLGSQTVTCSYTDNGGLSDSDSVTFSIVDTTAPVVTVTPDRLPDPNGWYNASVVFTTSGTDAVAIASCTADQTYTAPDGTDLTVSGSCTDIAGNVGNGTSAEFDFDDTNPTVSVTPARLADHNGWYNAAVVFDTSGIDATPGSGVSDANCTADQNHTSPDGEDLTISGSCTDNAGNVGNGTSAAFDFDDTNPTAEVTGYQDGDVFTRGAAGVPPTVGCSFGDNLSGVDSPSSSGPTLTAGGLTVNGVGSETYRCTAFDLAGNSSFDTEAYTVNYGGVSGILQPINPDNTSIFKRGQAVPVKFLLAGDEYTGFNTSGWSIVKQQVSCTAFDSLDGEVEVISNTPSTVFRYDASGDQYIYNADMKNLAVGSCWKFKVSLDSTQVLYSAIFKLAK